MAPPLGAIKGLAAFVDAVEKQLTPAKRVFVASRPKVMRVHEDRLARENVLNRKWRGYACFEGDALDWHGWCSSSGPPRGGYR